MLNGDSMGPDASFGVKMSMSCRSTSAFKGWACSSAVLWCASCGEMRMSSSSSPSSSSDEPLLDSAGSFGAGPSGDMPFLNLEILGEVLGVKFTPEADKLLRLSDSLSFSTTPLIFRCMTIFGFRDSLSRRWGYFLVPSPVQDGSWAGNPFRIDSSALRTRCIISSTPWRATSLLFLASFAT